MNTRLEVDARTTPDPTPMQQARQLSTELGVSPRVSIIMNRIYNQIAQLDSVGPSSLASRSSDQDTHSRARHRSPKNRNKILSSISKLLLAHSDELSQVQRIILAMCLPGKVSDTQPWTIARVSKSDYIAVRQRLQSHLNEPIEQTLTPQLLWLAITDPAVSPKVHNMFCTVPSVSTFQKQDTHQQGTGVAPETLKAIRLLIGSLDSLLDDPSVDSLTVAAVTKVRRRYFTYSQNSQNPEDVSYWIDEITGLIRTVVHGVPKYTSTYEVVTND